MTLKFSNNPARVEFVFSDVHCAAAAQGIYQAATEIRAGIIIPRPASFYFRAILNGDETAHPLINPLRELKKKVIAADGNYHAAEAQAWQDPAQRDSLVKAYRPCYDESLTIMRRLEDLRAQGVVDEFTKHDGNDKDRLRRIAEAEQWACRDNGQIPRPDLTDVIAHSQFSTVLSSPQVELCQQALTLRIPYIEARNANLGMYLSDIADQLCSTQVRWADVEQVLLISHTNADPRFRKEKKNGWWKDVYAIMRKYLPHVFTDGKIAQISGHDHYTLPLEVHPLGRYQYEGVWQIKIGMSDGKQPIPDAVVDLYQGHSNPHLQRSLLYLAADPLGTMKIIDTEI